MLRFILKIMESKLASRSCSRCGNQHSRTSGARLTSYCHVCHTAYMTERKGLYAERRRPWFREYMRKWRANPINLEVERKRGRAYARANREHRNQYAMRNGRPKNRYNAAGTYTHEQWLSCLTTYGHRCGYCGCDGRLTRDHDVPLSRGGSNDISNIVPACGRCNSSKRNLTAEEFRKWRVERGAAEYLAKRGIETRIAA